jgi:hypothetical protein
VVRCHLFVTFSHERSNRLAGDAQRHAGRMESDQPRNVEGLNIHVARSRATS